MPPKAYGNGTESASSNEVCETAPATPAPAAGFTADPVSGTAPLTVTFTDASTGDINARTRDFGDGLVYSLCANTDANQPSTALRINGERN